MTYRLSEEELADIQKRQATNLANFQRNSGRGLPAATVKVMEKAAGVKMDEHGVPVPKKLKKARAPKPDRLPVPTEEDECVNLYQWAQAKRWQGRPVSEYLIHVPNGAYLGADAKTRAITMGKLKAMGVQPGVFDYIVPVPISADGPDKNDCPGLWLEMKRTQGGIVSHDQKAFKRRMVVLGWRCEVAKGWAMASRIIEEHLRMASGYLP
jgi:hypothetical protein